MDEGTSGKHAHVSSYRAGGATRVVKAKLQCCRIARETLENTQIARIRNLLRILLVGSCATAHEGGGGGEGMYAEREDRSVALLGTRAGKK